MARVKLTEYKAKLLLYKEFGIPYEGVHVTAQNVSAISSLSSSIQYVVKVDQGIKKRMKQGLVKLNVKKPEIQQVVSQFIKKGYESFIVEQMISYNAQSERYIALERTREGIVVTYSKVGGIDVEENADKIKRAVLHSPKDEDTVLKELGIPASILQGMREFFEKYYVSFMEINPLVVEKGQVHILDLAVEVDSTAQFFVKDAWVEEDIVGEHHLSPEEQQVYDLNKKSQAALSLSLLNPNGSIWVLLSGGGASVTLADEVYNLGFGKELGNYGEYSGNPNAEETYLYTMAVLALMMKSSRRRLMLIIGGGVANFTDIRITFKGIIKALEEQKKNLKKKEIKIFVRRGGPFQENGLSMIEEWTKQNGMFGAVEGPNLPLHEVVRMGIKELQKK